MRTCSIAENAPQCSLQPKWEGNPKKRGYVSIADSPCCAVETNTHNKATIKCAHPVVQSCPTICDPLDYSSPNSSVCGIYQARILEWVASSSSSWSSQSRTWTCFSCISRQILYYWASWEAQSNDNPITIILKKEKNWEYETGRRQPRSWSARAMCAMVGLYFEVWREAIKMFLAEKWHHLTQILKTSLAHGWGMEWEPYC